MAKLKKFNNQTDYRTYIGSSEFSAPDVSAIGTSTVPADLDAEYNPLSMLHVNAKHSLAPTATTIPFIIDTITNGKVAIWWRPSTGSTYTKVNSTDLIFNSGFTENKITNLVINTKPTSTDYNNIYIVSAVSDTSTSINDTDTSTQYGLITLDGTTFNATGGSKTIQVKTAPGNKWQITDVPSWLTFSQITGSGPTSITVTADNYTSTTTDRSATVTIGYVDLEYTTTSGNFVQNKKVEDSYFEFSEHSLSLPAEATPITVVSYDASGSTIGKTIYFVSSDSSWLTVTPASTTATATGSINISTIANPNRTARTGTITARIGSSTGAIIDTINVSQQGAGGNFYVGSSVANAQSTSATTYAYPTTVGSADTASKTVYFATNYSASEVEALSVNYPTSISNVSVNTSNSSITFSFTERPIVTGATATTRNATITVGVATITATQAAPAYFKWDNSSITVGSSAGSTGSNTYSSNIAYSNITPSKSSTGTFITTGPTMNNTGVTFSVAANTTTEDKTCTITASLGSTTLDTFTVTQNGADAYFWTGSMNATAATTSVDSTGQTGCEVQCYSNRTSEYLNSITVSGNSSSWITNISWDSSTQKVSFNVNSYSGTDARSGIIGIYNSSGTMIGSINVNQGAAAPYFRFVQNNSTAYTYDTNTSAGTTFSVAIDTNYNLSDIKTAQAGSGINVHTYTSTTEVSVTTYTNPDTDSRTGYIYFYTGATSSSGRIGVLTVTQNAAEYATITGGGTYETGTTSDTVYFETNWDSSSLNTLTLETSGGTWLTLDSFSTPLVDGTYYTYRLSSNSSTYQRTGYILLKSGNFVLDYVTINQNGQSIPTYYLYFTNYSSVTTRTVTVDSDDTSYSEAISYSYPSLSTGKTSNISSVSYNSDSMTATFDENTSRDERTVGTATVQGTGGAGASITLTLEIKQYGVPAYLTWRDGSTTKSTTKGNNSDTYNDLISTNWTSSELNNLTVSSNVSWLTGGTVNTSSASYTVGANPAGSSSRTGTITWKNGSTTVLTLNVTQNAGESYYLYFTNYSSVTTRTVTVDSDDTSYSEAISYSYPSLSTGKTSNISSVSYNSDSMTATFDENTSRDERTVGTATVQGTGGAGASITLTLEIKQYGVPAYLTWRDGSTTKSTTKGNNSDTYNDLISTNWTSSELNNLTVSSNVSWLTGGTVNTSSASYTVGANPAGSSSRTGTITWKNGSTTVLTLNVTQNAGESYYLWITSTGQTGETFSCGSEASTEDWTILTNYSQSQLNSFTFSADTWITNNEFTTDSLSIDVANNPAGSAQRTGHAWIKSGSNTLLSVEVTQSAGESLYFTWASSSNVVPYSATSISNTYTTNWPSVTFENTGFVTGSTTGSNSSVTANFTTNTSTSSTRTGSVIAKYGSHSATWGLTQGTKPEEKYFNWERSSDSVEYNSTSTSNTYTTNYSSVTFTVSGMVTNYTTGSSSSVTATYSQNTSTTSRSGWVIAKYGNTTVGTWTISQEAQPKLFKWEDMLRPATTGLTTSVSYNSFTTSFTKSYDVTGYSVTNVVLDTNDTGITMSLSGNSITVSIVGGLPSGSRSASVKVKENDTIIGEWTIEIETNPTLEIINDSSVNIKVQGGTFAEIITISALTTGYMYLSGLEELSSFDIDAEGNMIGVADHSSNINVGQYPSHDIPIEVLNSAINSFIIIDG